jgi:transposase
MEDQVQQCIGEEPQDPLKVIKESALMDALMQAFEIGHYVGHIEMVLGNVFVAEHPDIKGGNILLVQKMFYVTVMSYVLNKYYETAVMEFPKSENLIEILEKIFEHFGLGDRATQICESLVKRMNTFCKSYGKIKTSFSRENHNKALLK